jgi:serine/threonine protein kinase
MATTTAVNRSIANYRIVELIGTGGMANIHKAIQLSLDRPVALKILHPHLLTSEGFVARFEKEAKQAALLQHENIVSIIDYGYDNGEYFIAMEYVDGKNLREILEKQKKLPLEICLLICHQVAEGLKYAHAHDIVHRDIKPANIVLSFDGRVMITDFGIAKATNDLSITATGLTIGSPAFMSPEQAAGKPTDNRSDIFSLGIILYEMISGEKPFKGDTYQSMVASIMSQKPTSLLDLRIDVTPEIELLTEKALAKVQDLRFQTADEFAEAIYAQLSKFKIPPTRTLISAYLKNPIKVTERLRADKISDHMDAALYSFTLGETKLAEAKREFQEVLRFDRNNKSARQYLSKLESHPALLWAKSGLRGSPFKINGVFILVAAVVAIMALTIFLIFASTEQGRLPTGMRPSASSSPALHTEGVVVPMGPSPAAEMGRNSTRSLPSTSDGKIPVADGRSSPYNYPKQDLARFGLLTVKTNVAAQIEIDHTVYGQANGPAIRLMPGRHHVEIRADGYDRIAKRIFIEKDKPAVLRFDLKPIK